MMHTREQLLHLVPELATLPAETEWLEFKVDNTDPEMIGKAVSALANSARIAGEDFGFLIWGVQDDTHRIVGTTFSPAKAKKGNEPLETWLARQIHPQVHLQFEQLTISKTHVVVLTIEPAISEPVKFNGVEYVRVGPSTRELSRNSDRARRLWRSFDQRSWAASAARERLTEEQVLSLLDYPSYFQLLDLPLPENRRGILDALISDDLISHDLGSWSITNLGGALFARRLSEFPSLSRKAFRVIRYRGSNRLETVKEQIGGRGYASGFEGLIDYVNGLLPTSEEIGAALRTTNAVYPPLVVRELVANALVHQDFGVTGAGPMVEIFDDRVEISNPGQPLIDKERLVDAPPRSRNEALASLLRRMGICEERGSGWDKVASQVEIHHLPAPEVTTTDETMRVTLLAQRSFGEMSIDERAAAVYLHACLNQVSRRVTNNSSIRERFGIEERNKAVASRLLRDTVSRGLIAPYDKSAAPKMMRYVPFWAAPDSGYVDGKLIGTHDDSVESSGYPRDSAARAR
ncbi:ATP-binding protein [Microbacterium hibisci]|uniref:ATP-binding protein n=1 Tax=Microbacterium hibisci TaxID=2036000 RepID=UPI0019433176|nr:ATP-binding protein [Microbacterium hibisci]